MIVRSTSPDVAIPDVSITEYVLRHAARLGDKPALIDGPTGRTLTYGQLADAVRRAAAGLARLGFRKGDVLAIYSPNLPEYAVVFQAVAMLGGVNTTANALVPGSVINGKKAVVQLGEVQILDSGPDGTRGNSDDERFAVQGIFLP